MLTYAKSSTNPMADTPDALRDEIKALHDRGVAEEKERQFEWAAETFRQAVELSRHETNPLAQLHCRWHHAMLHIEIGRCRQALVILQPLLTEDFSLTPEHADYLCGGMRLEDLHIGVCIAFMIAGLALPLPRKTIVRGLERFRLAANRIPGPERAVSQAVYQLCNLDYLLRYRKYQDALQAAELTCARLPADVKPNKFLCRAAEACLGLDDLESAGSYLQYCADELDGKWSFTYARVRVALEMRQQHWDVALHWAQEALRRSHEEGRRSEKRQAARQLVEVALACGNVAAGRQGLTELLRLRRSESMLERFELRLCLADWRRAGAAQGATSRRRAGFERARILAEAIDEVAGTRFRDLVEQRSNGY